MSVEWSPLETSRHQDHIIAHVLGATVLGFFLMDGAAHLVLDIGFIWTVYLDGEMALLPQGVAVRELELEQDLERELLDEMEQLNQGGSAEFRRMQTAPVECLIREVSFYASGERRRVTIEGENASLAIESSLSTGDIQLRAS